MPMLSLIFFSDVNLCPRSSFSVDFLKTKLSRLFPCYFAISVSVTVDKETAQRCKMKQYINGKGNLCSYF